MNTIDLYQISSIDLSFFFLIMFTCNHNWIFFFFAKIQICLFVCFFLFQSFIILDRFAHPFIIKSFPSIFIFIIVSRTHTHTRPLIQFSYFVPFPSTFVNLLFFLSQIGYILIDSLIEFFFDYVKYFFQFICKKKRNKSILIEFCFWSFFFIFAPNNNFYFRAFSV